MTHAGPMAFNRDPLSACSPALVRVSPHVDLVTTPRGLVLRDRVRGRELTRDGGMVEIAGLLARASSPIQPAAWLRHAVEGYGLTELQADDLLSSLMRESVLIEVTPELVGRDLWSRGEWEGAYDYHWHTREIPKPDWSSPAGSDADVAMMRGFVKEEHPPSKYWDRPTSRRVSLPREDATAEPTGPMVDTITSGDPGPLDLSALGHLLRLVVGQSGTRRLPITGEHVTKTSPSGGSRHPTEAHVCVLDVAGLESGTYHYSVRNHCLDVIDHEHPAAFVADDVVMLRGRVGFVPRAAVIFTSSVERSMFRYRDARSYRVLYLDLGHLMQTFAYAAAARGRPTYRGYVLRVGAVALRLGIDPLLHIPIGYGLLA